MKGGRKGHTPTTIPDLAAAGVASLILVFLLARAVKVPLTYDEAATFLRYIAADPLAVFDFSVATNHLLNTALVKLLVVVAGPGELVLRLPALAGYGLYATFVWLVLRRLRSQVVALGAFLVLVINPYLLDYFSLSRGYGLSLGLVTASLYFSVRFADSHAVETPSLARALALGGAAALASFSVLNVFAAIWIVGLVGCLRSARRSGVERFSRERIAPLRWRFLAFAAIYFGLVFSQDPGFSPALYESVTVRVLNADATAPGRIGVYRVDATGRTEPLRGLDEVWRLERAAPFYGIRVESPAEVNVEVVAGDKVFRDDRGARGLWTATSADGSRILESTPLLSLERARMPRLKGVINWKGDTEYTLQLVKRVALLIVLVAAGALLLDAAGGLLVRRNLIKASNWKALSGGALWTAALAGAPLYILQRNGELYYGGVAGLMKDTFPSLIEGSLYGLTYRDDQTSVALALALAILGLCGIAVGAGAALGRNWTRSAFALFAIFGLACALAVVQHALFGTPFPLGRTALYFIPLSVLIVAICIDALAASGAWGRAAAASAVAVVVSISLLHFRQTVNTTHTLDWPQDASTRAMMDDLRAAARHGTSDASRVSLGVQWIYYPVAEYYARRFSLPVDVRVLPHAGGTDYAYGDEQNVRGAMILGRYPKTGTVLVRSK